MSNNQSKTKLGAMICVFLGGVCFLGAASVQAEDYYPAYEVGDVGPGGGLVFFVDQQDVYPSFTYLEAAPSDVQGSWSWCDENPLLPSKGIPAIGRSGGGYALGRGQVNTEMMLAYCVNGAAHAAKAYVSPNGTEDWFLPSMGELELMFANLWQVEQANVVNSYQMTGYWSSTEFTAMVANYVYVLSDGTYGAGYEFTKASHFQVHPIRAF